MTRFAFSAAISLPVTVALLFLMTRLILPGEHDRIVTRMIRNIELQRTVRPVETGVTQVSERQQLIEKKPLPTRPDSTVDNASGIQNETTRSDNSSKNGERARVVDWWAEAHRLSQKSDEEAFKQWSLEQGFEHYSTIMQGPLPITNAARATLPPNQEDATGYLNIYGDMEYKISDNCVATTQVMVAMDDSDFVRALPMIITCKSPPKQRFNFDRE